MFRNRKTSQKPAEQLYSTFRQSFPEVRPTSSGVPDLNTISIADALTDATIDPRNFMEGEDMKDHDPTPRGSHDQWRFTPSLLDPNSFAFASFANQPPGYYTPTPGGTNTLYHSQAGDLHTPGMGMGMDTPLSGPTSEIGFHAGSTLDLHDFHSQSIHPHHFHSSGNFGPQESFAPSQFSHHSTGFDTMDASGDHSPMDDMGMDTDMHEKSPLMGLSHSFDENMSGLPVQTSGKFRYHVTLNAPTAMVKHPDEIPVTYLNKGQAYSVSIIDTAPAQQTPGLVRYRTHIRISFEDEQQRQRPAACWQLWKEGRGTNEAHQRGGKLQAVEYVDPNQGGDEDTRRPRVELDTASFDGFSVVWSPSPSGTADCSVAVRFNFLSTDFSHSKGVKGIPVRLCAKTEVVSIGSPIPTTSRISEVCYCKVKLFRDHGAERKLSNDVAHVKKTIDKLKQQIAQAETGMKDFGKRKRSGSIAKMSANSRPGKVQKHKRTWSMSSASSTGGRHVTEDDLQLKLAALQDMFTSTRPVSILYLSGQEADDPDLHPVFLTGEPQDLTKMEPVERSTWDRRESVATSNAGRSTSLVSPTPSSQSLQSQDRRSSVFQQATPFNPSLRQSEWTNSQQTGPTDLQSNPQHLASPPDHQQPVKVKKQSEDQPGMLTSWIEALDVDSAYQPPPERSVKPVACFYILPRVAGKAMEHGYYRAIYLMERSSKELVNSIASKCHLDPNKIVRTIHVNHKGLHILIDDDVVRELPEGQDMNVEFCEIKPKGPMSREWATGSTDIQVDGNVSSVETVESSGLELRLYC
ncbi:MAG: hypothetical protein M1819_003090 [Sarea resinae]|nr:MAG: hypothetical protein M1819_003090 [Sarea resinae]